MTGEGLGALIRWLAKGCKTDLKDEAKQNFKNTTINVIIGYIAFTVFIVLLFIFGIIK